MAKPFDQLSASELAKRIDRAGAEHSRTITALIAAGYGNETGASTRKRAAETGDKLACDYVAACETFSALCEEQRVRRSWHGCDKPIRKPVVA